MQNITELTTGQIFIDNNDYQPSLVKTKITKAVTPEEILANERGYLKVNAQNNDVEIDLVKKAEYETNLLNKARENKKAQLKQAFESSLENGKFMSQVIGIEVDCRRGGTKNDIQNMEIIHKHALDSDTINFIGVTSQKPITKTQLGQLISEAEIYAYGIYQKKFAKDSALQKAATIQDIEAIVW